MKRLGWLAATVLCAGAASAVELVETSRQTIREEAKPMNFCFANNFPDGTIYLSHSIGTHMKDERHVNVTSRDNGKTWQSGGPTGGMNTFLTKDGRKRRVSSWSLAVTNVHDIQVMTLGSDGKPVRKVVKVKTPRMQQFRLHRNVVRLADGRLLLTGYSQDRKTKPWHCTAFAVCSDDDGETWKYLSNFPDRSGLQEGFNEGTVVQLKNGDVLAFVRTGNKFGAKNKYIGLVRFRSRDGGRSWVDEGEVAEYGVDPQAFLLSDGTLALVSGRPGVYILLDPTGTGDKFERFDVYKGMGSSYSTLMETAPGKLLLVYDESSFIGKPGETPTNRVVAVNFNYKR